MRKLSSKEIEILASRGARRIAVENFLSSMGFDYFEACENLKLDTKLYKWNAQTNKAIKYGIELAMKEPDGTQMTESEEGGEIMFIYQEFSDMINKETDPDIIDAVWKWDFNKLREFRRKRKEVLSINLKEVKNDKI